MNSDELISLFQGNPSVTGKREIILAKAADLFFNKGYYPTKMEEIAHAAGIGKGTIYEYFSSKKDLFTEMIVWGTDLYMNYLQKEMMKVDTLKEKLEKCACLIINLFRHHISAHLMNVLMSGPHVPGEEICESIQMAREKHLSLLDSVLHNGISDGSIREDMDTRFLAEAFMGSVVNSCMAFMNPKEPIDDLPLAQKITTLFLEGANKRD